MNATTKDLISSTQQQLREQVVRDSENALGVIFPALVEQVNTVAAKLPEHIFVQYFLPYFSGILDLSSRPQIMAEWISIAGSPMAEVAVINTTGQTLFYVPGIFDTSFINVNRKNRSMSFPSIADQTNLISSNLPALGERFLHDALNSKFHDIASGPIAAHDHQQRWLEIFARYGVAAPALNAAAPGVQYAAPVSDDEIYD